MTSWMGPRVLYGALAQAEAVTWGFLLLGMFAKHVVGGTEVGVQVAGPVHGFVFLAFALVTVLVGTDARWGLRRILVGLLSAVVPFASIPFEERTERAGLVPDRWRLREEPARGPAERVVGAAVRAPVAAALVSVVLLAVVFTGLLAAGPPTEWGS